MMTASGAIDDAPNIDAMSDYIGAGLTRVRSASRSLSRH
jgi:hypothetical protein